MSSLNTTQVCRLVKMKPARLNEVIHHGLYTLAPKTSRGSYKLFGEGEFLALWIFAGFLSSVKPSAAERHTRLVLDAIAKNPDEKVVHIEINQFQTLTYNVGVGREIFRAAIAGDENWLVNTLGRGLMS